MYILNKSMDKINYESRFLHKIAKKKKKNQIVSHHTSDFQIIVQLYLIYNGKTIIEYSFTYSSLISGHGKIMLLL